MLSSVLIVIATFLSMEFVAWFSHKYIMHGFLWNLHRDHHQVNRGTFFERNDFFFLLYALPGITLLVLGGEASYDFKFWIGAGITIYGMAYFFVHDIFIHQRFKLMRNADSIYFRAIRKAHKVHHKHLQKEDGECFGMLLVPMKYFTAARKATGPKM
ncbi:MAG: beta-carotene 3-hydroxylase [Polaribacter sp.]|jgi:beta-carotene 3-hydroxylase